VKVYIAAPYGEAIFVRTEVFSMLRAAGLEPVATWAVEANGEQENLLTISREILRSRWIRNRSDLTRSDAVLVIARDGCGGEMFAEIEQARFAALSIYWCGRLTLSAFDVHVRVRESATIDGIARAVGAVRAYAMSLGQNVVPIKKPPEGQT